MKALKCLRFRPATPQEPRRSRLADAVRAAKPGPQAPRGWGRLTNPPRAAHNRLYSRVTVSLWRRLRELFRSPNEREERGLAARSTAPTSSGAPSSSTASANWRMARRALIAGEGADPVAGLFAVVRRPPGNFPQLPPPRAPSAIAARRIAFGAQRMALLDRQSSGIGERMRILVLAGMACVVALLPARASAVCRYDSFRFYFDGGSSSSNGTADSGKACELHLTGPISSVEVSQQPQHGSAAWNGSFGYVRIVYKSIPGYKGPDAFTIVLHGTHTAHHQSIEGVSTQTINMTVQ